MGDETEFSGMASLSNQSTPSSSLHAICRWAAVWEKSAMVLDVWVSEQSGEDEVSVMDEEDYAVKAAKEWLAVRQELVYASCDCATCKSNQAYNAKEIEQLAAVIRKHVEEDKEIYLDE